MAGTFSYQPESAQERMAQGHIPCIYWDSGIFIDLMKTESAGSESGYRGATVRSANPGGRADGNRNSAVPATHRYCRWADNRRDLIRRSER
jgi:hypothetical protein